jgi:hypothetical protein
MNKYEDIFGDFILFIFTFSLFLSRCPVAGTGKIIEYTSSLKTGFRIRIRIRINLSCWIRIRIQIADRDPGGQK